MSKRKGFKNITTTVLSAVLFIAVLLVFFFGLQNFSSSARENGVSTTKEAIERAAILCYASEGFFPPGLSYIEENYGVQIDRSIYHVRYEVFASNIMPDVQVTLLYP